MESSRSNQLLEWVWFRQIYSLWINSMGDYSSLDPTCCFFLVQEYLRKILEGWQHLQPIPELVYHLEKRVYVRFNETFFPSMSFFFSLIMFNCFWQNNSFVSSLNCNDTKNLSKSYCIICINANFCIIKSAWKLEWNYPSRLRHPLKWSQL